MGADRTAAASAERAESATLYGDAKGGECHLLYRAERLPLADAAADFPPFTTVHRLLSTAGGRWHVVPRQPRSSDAHARVGGAEASPSGACFGDQLGPSSSAVYLPGIINQHFIPFCADNGVTTVAVASDLVMMGVFNFAGTITSGWLSDRFDNRILLACCLN